MKRRKNPYPGVRKNIVKGRIYWRFEMNGFRCNLPGPYGSVDFKAAYEAAMNGVKIPTSSAEAGSVEWLIGRYLGSLRFSNLSATRKRSIRGELDWLRDNAGRYQFSELEVRHIEALMAKKSGPVAANTVKKNMSMLFNFAAKKEGYKEPNPAKYAEKLKVNPDGYHTWTDEEVDRFLAHHPPGSKARLVLLLALNTGMSRTDLSRVGWQHVSKKSGKRRIAYKRSKTSVSADMPILPALAKELDRLPAGQMLFVTHGGPSVAYKPETLGNWFHDRCVEAGVPGALHGLRKAGATCLAEAGATDWEIASYLAHTDTKQAAVYVRKANHAKLADSGFAKLRKMSNPSVLLGGDEEKYNEHQ